MTWALHPHAAVACCVFQTSSHTLSLSPCSSLEVEISFMTDLRDGINMCEVSGCIAMAGCMDHTRAE